MPVFAQTCRRGPTEARPQDPVSASIQTSGSGTQFDAGGGGDSDDDISNLQKAVDSAIKIRELQTANIDKYLAATGQSGRHGYAGTNRTISLNTGSGTNTGYITDKGLFKPWPTVKLMNDSSGKYGCPVVTNGTAPRPLDSSYKYPVSNSRIYVGAAIEKTSPPTTAEPAIFVGSDMTNANGGLLPACGNEGMNVQVVYPGKATGFNYVGTYNIGTPSSTGYELQNDIKNVTFQKCMERAEDKGASLFSYAENKCYINTNSLSDATSAGLAIELKPSTSLPNDYRGGQQLLHFGKDGTLNVLNSKTPTNGQTNIVYKFGLENPLSNCDFKEGGVIMKIGGSWGMNCNAIEKSYIQEEKLYDGYRSNDATHVNNLGKLIKDKGATNIRYESRNDRVKPNSFCNIEMGEACGQNDKPQTYNEWLRLGGSCPNRAYRPYPTCTTGCQRKSTELFTYGSWFCA
jgi:hypothetical protein